VVESTSRGEPSEERRSSDLDVSPGQLSLLPKSKSIDLVIRERGENKRRAESDEERRPDAIFGHE
jgi:hypothetical protein